MKQQKQTILIELDALIDTRLGTLKQCFSEAAKKLDLESYVRRVKADFWTELGISTEQFTTAYKKRNVDTLLASMHTGLYHNLPLLLGGLLLNGLTSPVHEELKININTYPYELNEDELEDIVYCFQQRLWKDCEITTVFYKPEDITPAMLVDISPAYILYDIELWLGAQQTAFLEKRIPTVTAYYPAVINHYDATEYKEMLDKQIDPFADLRRRMAEYITLDGVDASIFSCHYHLQHP